MSCFLKVFGRVRPSASGNKDTALTVVDKNHVKIEAEGKCEKMYELHRIFPCSSSQDEVFSSVAKKLVEECTEGINVTIFAYGQTGSGKTHTMLGRSDSWSDPHEKGIIPRSIEYLFDQLEKKAEECQKFSFKVNVEFVELYNEEIFDLLSVQNASKIILRDTGNDIMLSGSKSESVDNSLDLMNIVKKGWQSRRTGATAMNRDSSRSHALLIVKIITEEVNGDLRTTRASTLNLVDLAGSERQSHTKATGERLKEATNINSSLTVLGRCIRMLAKPSTSQSFIPYRDSHLTHILKNSLGGNSKTAVIVNMHPDRSFIAESASTLGFAEACTMIKNKVLRNEVMTGDQENSYKRAIQELRRENEETRAKAYNEFAKRLEDAEEHQHRLASENTSLKADISELRAKYNMGLVKFMLGSNTNEFPDNLQLLLQRENTAEDVHAKLITIKLELEASEKRCRELQEQRDSNAEKFFNTTCILQTPRVKKRQSSFRNPRRETIYCPSPALSENIEDSETEVKLQESELRIAQLETENQMMKSKFEKAVEDMFKAQEARESAVVSYEAKIENLNEEIEHLNLENSDLESKIKSGKNTLDKLLNMIKEKEHLLLDQKTKQAEVENKFSEDMDNMRNYYDTEKNNYEDALAAKEKELDEWKKKFDILQKEIDEKSRIIVELDDSLKTSTSSATEVEQLKAILEEKDAALAKKTTELNQKADFISKLETRVESSRSSSEEVSTLRAELKKKSHLEEDLQNVINELEKAQKNEQNLKKVIEDVEKDKENLYHDYQKDIKNTKVKAEAAVQGKQKSLDEMQKLLDSQKQALEKQKNDAERMFEENIASFKKHSDEEKKKKLQEKEEEVRKEMNAALKKQRELTENEISSLRKTIEFLEKQHKEDSIAISNQFGSSNRNQKLSYMEKLREKAKDLEAENSRLLEEITRLKSGKDVENRRVLRSRNPV